MKKIKEDKRGAALVVAMVILLLVMILSLSLVFVSYSLYHTALRQNQMEQCKEIAQGVSKELEKEIVDFRYDDSMTLALALDGDTASSEEGPDEEGHQLWKYLRCNLWQTGWPYYNEGETRHSMKEARRTFEFQVQGYDEMPGTVTVDMYWESERDADNVTTPFFISVTCAIGQQKSTITSEYELHIDRYIGEDLNVEEQLWEHIPMSPQCNPSGNMIRLDENWVFLFSERE